MKDRSMLIDFGGSGGLAKVTEGVGERGLIDECVEKEFIVFSYRWID